MKLQGNFERDSGANRGLRWKRLFLGAAAAGLALVGAAADAGVLIVRSAGPSAKSYPAGRSLPDTARLTLQPGDVVVLLGNDSTRTLRGPGTFTLGSPRPAGGIPMAALARRGRFSALRSGEMGPRNPSIWNVDVSQSGKVCVSNPGAVTLWRPDANDASTVKLAAAGGSAQEEQWPAGEPTLAWPQRLPIAAGSEYEVSLAGSEAPSRVRFDVLPAVPSDTSATAQLLLEKGCQHQLDLLLETVPTEPAAPDK
ncbi:MAG TPA: hypothetical protein VF727_02085 [Allosphingosinicella sp.]|jgi:hypothetical protein